MTPLRERNPVPVALISIAVIILLVVAAFNAASLPFIGGGTVYKADFTDAAGVQPNDDIRIAGVKVGQVDSVGIKGNVVQVSFRVDPGHWIGNASTAAIKIKTLLGQKYIAITPDGDQKLRASVPIPTSRTTTPLDVTAAFQGLGGTVGKIDTAQLGKAFDTIASTFKDSPQYVRSSLTGLSRLSKTIASRDAQLAQLLGHARNVTGVLAARDAEVRKLIDDGDVVLRLVEQQRAVIHSLLVNATTLSDQLSGLVTENRKIIGPALGNLHSVLTILARNQGALDQTIHLLAPFVRDFDNVLGTGGWFDTFVANLGPGNSFQPSTN